MNTKKSIYESPASDVLEIRMGGVLCWSGLGKPDNYEGGEDPFVLPMGDEPPGLGNPFGGNPFFGNFFSLM